MKREALVPLIKAALDKLPPEAAAPAFAVDPADASQVRRHLPRRGERRSPRP